MLNHNSISHLTGRPISFSVVVPTYNRLPLLQKTIQSIIRQDYSDFEVIVVNDGSTDGTREYLEQMQSMGKLRCFHQENMGPARGRNLGWKNARNGYIAFIDDDCIAPPNWLAQYSARFREWKCDAVGGGAVTGNPENIYALTNDHIMNFFKGTINGRATTLPFLTSNNTVYSSDALRMVNGFDPAFRLGAEERDLNLRLVENGSRLTYDPQIIVNHNNDENFSGFIRHQYLTGRGSFLFYRNARKRRSSFRIVEPRNVYFRLLISPWSTFPCMKAVTVTLLIVLGQISVTVGYLAARIDHGTR